MSEKRCENCRFWEKPLTHADYGDCESVDVRMNLNCNDVVSSPFFSCICWQRREPDLREQLGKYLKTLLLHYEKHLIYPSEWQKPRSLCVADEIIAIFEKSQKGKGNE